MNSDPQVRESCSAAVVDVGEVQQQGDEAVAAADSVELIGHFSPITPKKYGNRKSRQESHLAVLGEHVIGVVMRAVLLLDLVVDHLELLRVLRLGADDVADLVLEPLEDRVAAAGQPRDAVRARLALTAGSLGALAGDGIADACAPELPRGRLDQVLNLNVCGTRRNTTRGSRQERLAQERAAPLG